MKQKLETIKLLLTISLAGLLLFACQVDKDLTNENLYEKNGTIMHKKFEELIQETQFKTAFEKISKLKKGFSNRGNATSRTVMEHENGFTIADFPANVIVSDSITSYTFLIKRNNTPSNVFENLIINIKQNQEPEAFILKYESITSLDDVPFNPNTFQGKRYLNPIEYNPNEYVPNTGKITYSEVCRTVTSWYCYGPGEHNDRTDCSMGFGISYEICTTVGYDDGQVGGSSGGSSSSGGGGGGTPIPTAPVPPAPKPPKPPCEKLKNILNPSAANFKPTLDNLHTTITPTSTGEDGAVFNKNALGNYLPAQSVPSTNTNRIKVPLTSDSYCYVHTHPLDCYPMFSWSDVNTLLTLVGTASAANVPEVTIMLVVKDDAGVNQVYALTIDDILNFSIKVNDAINNVDLPMFVLEQTRLDELDKKMGYEYANDNNYERAFLKIFEEFNITLSKANSSLTGWEQLAITNPDTSPSTVNNTPCN